MPASSSSPPLRVGLVLFPNVTQLDVTGPYEIFARMPSTRVHLLAATLAPVRSAHGLTIVPDATFDTSPALDVICVPGGPGVDRAMEDQALLRFLQTRASRARYVTSVSTGALVLGAAGLLHGYRATTHWLSLDLLPLFGAHPVEERIVIDRNRITAGGVTAGLDFGLIMASHVCDATVGQEIQLMLEYNPAPPYQSGSPSVAAPDLVRRIVWTRQRAQSDRRTIARQAAGRLNQVTSGAISLFNPFSAHDTLAGFAESAGDADGMAIDELAPGTTLIVNTRNSQYRLVMLVEPQLALVQGGAMFPEPTMVRIDGATAGGSALKKGWILVGFEIEMWLGSVRIRSTTVRSVRIESVPPLEECEGVQVRH